MIKVDQRRAGSTNAWYHKAQTRGDVTVREAKRQKERKRDREGAGKKQREGGGDIVRERK